VFNPLVLGLSAQRIQQNTQDSNGYPLLRMFLANSCRQHLVFSPTHSVLNNVVSGAKGLMTDGKNVENQKHLMKADNRLFYMLLYSVGGNKLMTHQSMLRI